MDGYMIDVQCDQQNLRVHAKDTAARGALTGWDVTLVSDDDGKNRVQTRTGATDVVILRSDIAGVTLKKANPLVNGNLIITTTEGKKYQLHFRRKQRGDFERLAQELGGGLAQPAQLGHNSATASVWDLPGQDGTYGQEVVGESFYVAQFARLLKGVHVDSEGVDLSEKASLVPEPGNAYDPLAVAVVIRGQMVGHLPGDAAARYQPTLLAAANAGRDPQVDALLRARADEHEVGKVWHSVRLDLAPLEVVTAN
jgi:hypothetical protein